MRSTMIAVAMVALSMSVLVMSAPYIGVVRQDGKGKAQIGRINLATQLVEQTSPLQFTYRAPLVQMTFNPNTGQYIIVSYPSDNATVYGVSADRDLPLAQSWTTSVNSFFDFQYSPQQNTYYGICVEGTYGRILSNFTLGRGPNDITVQKLIALPFMWFVNASSFDGATSRYFALVNNFPGKPNSTTEQLLIVANFGQYPPTSSTFHLPAATQLRFVAWSSKNQQLYGWGWTTATESGNDNNHALQLVVINVQTGDVKIILTINELAHGATAGPLVADNDGSLWAFAFSSSPDGDLWRSLHIDLTNPTGASYQFAGAFYNNLHFGAAIYDTR